MVKKFKTKPKPKSKSAKAPKKSSGKRSVFRKVLKWAGLVVLGFVALSVLSVLVFRFVNPPVTPLMISRSAGGVKTQAKGPWIPYGQIPQSMMDAVVASEDNRFASHHGFDFGEMREAYRQNKKGKRLRGASTITQQTCKNVFLWNGRSYVRKGLEAWFTVLVELLWSKQRIMEVYLNVIETGNGIYGIGAAAQVYYHKQAARLSREEAAMIAAVLPSPRKCNPAKPTEYMRQRQRQILDLMDKTGTVRL